MLNSDTEILFPIRVISELGHLRGSAWQALIDQLTTKDTPEIDQIAFTGMLVKLAGCAGCNADSFRAMRGCTQCAKLTVKRYKGSDQDLITLFLESREEVEGFISKRIL